MRDEFERWIASPPYEKPLDINPETSGFPGQYRAYEVQLAWEAWEAGSLKRTESVRDSLVSGQTRKKGSEDSMKVWILTSKYNEYNQYGEYFEKVFSEKPTEEQLIEADVPREMIGHVLNGGGRKGIENQWWYLWEYDC